LGENEAKTLMTFEKSNFLILKGLGPFSGKGRFSPPFSFHAVLFNLNIFPSSTFAERKEAQKTARKIDMKRPLHISVTFLKLNPAPNSNNEEMLPVILCSKRASLPRVTEASGPCQQPPAPVTEGSCSQRGGQQRIIQVGKDL